MAEKTNIEWTDSTWNPVTGCTPISAGCDHCYAQAYLHRFNLGKKIRLKYDQIARPEKWKRPRKIFVCSLSDLFHPDIPGNFRTAVYNTMTKGAPQHIYQVLTKRAHEMLLFRLNYGAAPNVWHGVTVENQDAMGRISLLRKIASPVRFLSCEPLLGPLINLNLKGIHWVIVGGESGPKSRPMQPGWVREIRHQCRAAGVAFFFKQWGGHLKEKNGSELDGWHYKEMP